jgi:predicted DNA-binding transcriptional regulator AlpA
MQPLWTKQELGEFLGVSTYTLDKWRLTGEGPAYVETGGRTRYRPEDVAEWVTNQTRNTKLAGGEVADNHRPLPGKDVPVTSGRPGGTDRRGGDTPEDGAA